MFYTVTINFVSFLFQLSIIKIEVKVVFFNVVAERECFYYFNDILNLVMMLRIVVVLKILINSTYWNTYRASRIWF